MPSLIRVLVCTQERCCVSVSLTIIIITLKKQTRAHVFYIHTESMVVSGSHVSSPQPLDLSEEPLSSPFTGLPAGLPGGRRPAPVRLVTCKSYGPIRLICTAGHGGEPPPVLAAAEYIQAVQPSTRLCCSRPAGLLGCLLLSDCPEQRPPPSRPAR